MCLITHQTAAAGAGRHQTVFAQTAPELSIRLIVPQFGDGMGFDISDQIVMVIPAWRHIAIGVDLHHPVNGRAAVISECGVMVGVITLQILGLGQMRQDDV